VCLGVSLSRCVALKPSTLLVKSLNPNGFWLILYFFDSFSVPANFRSLVYFYGIKNGGVKEWDFAFEQFQKTTIASERRKILYGLSGASEPWILSRYKTQFGTMLYLRKSIFPWKL